MNLRAEAKAVEAEHALQAAADFAEQGYQLLSSAIGGNARSEDEQALSHWKALVQHCMDLNGHITAARCTIAAEIVRLRGVAGHQPDQQSDGRGVAESDQHTTAKARDGSRYPIGAAWCVDVLPPRVRVGMRQATVGYVDGSFSAFQSGEDDAWSPEVKSRMAQLGIRTTMRLHQHVELKVAMMMIKKDLRTSTVTINHSPCGSQPDQATWRACHQVLGQFLPRGYKLLVQGTDQQGAPFLHTYEGRA